VSAREYFEEQQGLRRGKHSRKALDALGTTLG